jgi:hypothetical protein
MVLRNQEISNTRKRSMSSEFCQLFCRLSVKIPSERESSCVVCRAIMGQSGHLTVLERHSHSPAVPIAMEWLHLRVSTLQGPGNTQVQLLRLP